MPGTDEWRAVVPLADGVEEMEAVIAVDMLRRAGWSVQVAGLAGGGLVRASRGVGLMPDTGWDAVDWSGVRALVLPGGGPGAEALAGHSGVLGQARALAAMETGWVAAVCAAPLALEAAGLLEGRRYTSHPSVREQLVSGTWCDQPVVRDERLLTAQGPGSCMAWIGSLIAATQGEDRASEVLRPMGCDAEKGLETQ